MTFEAIRDQRRARAAEIRNLVRRSHPDIGGDPAAFSAELERIENRYRTDIGPTPGAPIIVLPTRPIRAGLRRVAKRVRRTLSRTRYIDISPAVDISGSVDASAPADGRTTAAPDRAHRTSGEPS